MSLNWIKITDRVRDGLTLMNKIPLETFCNVLQYVNRQMLKSHGICYTHVEPNESVNLENENTLEELECLVAIDRPDFLLLIKTMSYILRRINMFIVKPYILHVELKNKLQLNDETKIDSIVSLWMRQTKPIIEELSSECYEENVLVDVAWKLNVQISSQFQQRDKSALALLQLKTYTGEDLKFEMSNENLVHLNKQLESVQSELDGLNLTAEKC